VIVMSDPLPTDPAVAGSLSAADREARIEQLLLSGLDQYFAGRYERAINIWTRVAFLERGHGRARAYIERARGALAEGQRESEELAHAGIEAYNAGELQAARELLTRATTSGGSDTALLFIDRLQRLDAAPGATRVPPVAPRSAEALPGAVPPRHRSGWLLTLGASVAVAGGILLGSLPVGSWLAQMPIASPSTEVRPAVEPLPIVTASEMRIARARTMFTNGRLNEALRSLDEVDVGDMRRPDADRLRADIQRALLGLGAR
jgi:hypothetical protein